MAYENFSTGWTETDPSNKLSQTTTRSTFTDLTREETASLDKDDAILLDGDFDIVFEVYLNSSSDITDIYLLDTGSWFDPDWFGGFNIVLGYTGSKMFLFTSSFTFPSEIADEDSDDTTLLPDTIYYFRYKRDDDGGTYNNGLITLDVYATSADRQTETNSLLQLSVDCGDKIDLTYISVPIVGDESNANGLTGYLENLDLAYVPPAPPSGRLSTLALLGVG
jgi:hypothetical protein